MIYQFRGNISLNQQTHSPLITFVVVCCAIFGFSVLIVWLFNFLQNKVINRCFILIGICKRTACKFRTKIFRVLSERTVLLIRKSAQPRVYYSRLTLMRWKLTLQLAPAREGMKRSPCLLGEDRGELVGVRVRTAPTAFYRGEERERAVSDWKPNTNRAWTVIWQVDNKTGR